MEKIIMIGMNPRTRGLIPWDEAAQFWTLNEGPSKDWLKRYDVLFQIHPRWDWDRSNNIADPNHPLYIKATSGPCLYCKGSGQAKQNGLDAVCPWCNDGQYVVPEHRYYDYIMHGGNILDYKPKKIIMQDDNSDVPGCIEYPIKTITEELTTDNKPYFTSTLAHMLAFAIACHPEATIELYGWEAESGTEYANQRPCIEYWIGYARGKGIEITSPGSGLATGKHYGYQDFDQGYRSRLEMRRQILNANLNAAEVDAIKSEGTLEALTPFKNMRPITKKAWEDAYDDHFRKKNFVSFIRGTLKELNNLIDILDAYRQDSDEATQADIKRLIEQQYGLG